MEFVTIFYCLVIFYLAILNVVAEKVGKSFFIPYFMNSTQTFSSTTDNYLRKRGGQNEAVSKVSVLPNPIPYSAILYADITQLSVSSSGKTIIANKEHDNFYISLNGGLTWTTSTIGSSSFCAVSGDGQILYTVNPDNIIHRGVVTDRGIIKWSPLKFTDIIIKALSGISTNEDGTAAFITGDMTSTSSPDIVHGIYSDNVEDFSTFTLLKDLTKPCSYNIMDSTGMNLICGMKDESSSLKLLLSPDGGASFTLRPNNMESMDIPSLSTSSSQANQHIQLIDKSSLMVSKDNGNSFSVYQTEPVHDPFKQIVSTGNSDSMYIAATDGMYCVNNHGTTWSKCFNKAVVTIGVSADGSHVFFASDGVLYRHLPVIQKETQAFIPPEHSLTSGWLYGDYYYNNASTTDCNSNQSRDKMNPDFISGFRLGVCRANKTIDTLGYEVIDNYYTLSCDPTAQTTRIQAFATVDCSGKAYHVEDNLLSEFSAIVDGDDTDLYYDQYSVLSCAKFHCSLDATLPLPVNVPYAIDQVFKNSDGGSANCANSDPIAFSATVNDKCLPLAPDLALKYSFPQYSQYENSLCEGEPISVNTDRVGCYMRDESTSNALLFLEEIVEDAHGDLPIETSTQRLRAMPSKNDEGPIYAKNEVPQLRSYTLLTLTEEPTSSTTDPSIDSDGWIYSYYYTTSQTCQGLPEYTIGYRLNYCYSKDTTTWMTITAIPLLDGSNKITFNYYDNNQCKGNIIDSKLSIVNTMESILDYEDDNEMINIYRDDTVYHAVCMQTVITTDISQLPLPISTEYVVNQHYEVYTKDNCYHSVYFDGILHNNCIKLNDNKSIQFSYPIVYLYDNSDHCIGSYVERHYTSGSSINCAVELLSIESTVDDDRVNMYHSKMLPTVIDMIGQLNSFNTLVYHLINRKFGESSIDGSTTVSTAYGLRIDSSVETVRNTDTIDEFDGHFLSYSFTVITVSPSSQSIVSTVTQSSTSLLSMVMQWLTLTCSSFLVSLSSFVSFISSFLFVTNI